MKRNSRLYIIFWAVLLALFNVVCFVTPNKAAGLDKFGGAFWVGYAFITAAFIGQLLCAYIAFKAENLKKLFYNLPLITLSYIGLVLTLVFGGAAMVIPDLPGWAGAVICLLILGFNTLAIIKAKAAARLAESVDKKISHQTGFIKSLTAEAESLVSHAKSESVKAECKKVCEAVRYSDPVSSIRLADVEEKISTEMRQLSDAASNDDPEIAALVASELISLLDDRNKRCRLDK